MIIGIHGYKLSGKDTVARLIRELLPEVPVVSFAYADRLKKSLATLTGTPLEVFYDEAAKNVPLDSLGGKTPREAMTGYHDVMVPMFGADVFVAPVIRDADAALSTDPSKIVLVTDVRYPDRETNWIRDRGGFIAHIAGRGEPGNHSSERPWEPKHIKTTDWTIYNDGSLQDLRAAVEVMLYAKLGVAAAITL